MVNDERSLFSTLKRGNEDLQFFKNLYYEPDKTVSKLNLPPEEERLLKEFLTKINEQTIARKQVDSIFECMLSAFSDMRIMNWGIFLVGLFLIGLSIFFALFGNQQIYTLLFGTGGIVSLVAQLLITPFKQVRYSLATLIQSRIIYESYNRQDGIWYEFQARTQESQAHLSLEEAKIANQAYSDARENIVNLLQGLMKEQTDEKK